MATLYELTEEYQRLYQMADELDLSLEDIEDTLEGIHLELDDKIEACAKVIRRLEGDIDIRKAEIDRLSSRNKTAENSIKRIKQSIEMAMRASGRPKIKTALFSFGIQKNPPSLKIDQPDKVPAEYLIPQDPKMDNAGIKKFLKSLDEDGHCSWAHLEQSESLRIR